MKTRALNTKVELKKTDSKDRITGEENEHFLKRYDEVLNKYILKIFRVHAEENGRAHDHRTVKIIQGDVAQLRLDSLQGQADGIKITFENDPLPMYFWFSPDFSGKRIEFKIAYGKTGPVMIERYDLKEISENFLTELIASRHNSLAVFHS